MGLFSLFAFSFTSYLVFEMKVLKGMTLLGAFSAFFWKASFIFGFFVGTFKAFLSYFCLIGISDSAVQDASVWVVNLGLIVLSYFVYQKFFK